jgi:hypothetical protein
MHEFDTAFHHYTCVVRKKRLVVLMMLDDLSFTDSVGSGGRNLECLRQYIRQYTYVDYKADDYFDKLLYALPMNGMLQKPEQPKQEQQQQQRQQRQRNQRVPKDRPREETIPLLNKI